jgi:hypothetical protein
MSRTLPRTGRIQLVHVALWLVWGILSAIPVFADVDSDRVYAIRNDDFSAGLVGWTSPAARDFIAGAAPDGRNAALVPSGSGQAILRLSLAVGGVEGLAPAPNGTQPGERCAFRVRVWIDASATSGGVRLRLLRVGPSGAVEVARSIRRTAVDGGLGRWTWLVAEAPAGPEGRIAFDTSDLRMELESDLDGELWCDRCIGGPWSRTQHALEAGGFEAAALGQSSNGNWRTGAGASVPSALTGRPARRGLGRMQITGAGHAALSTRADGSLGSPWIGEALAVGAWFAPQDHPDLSLPSARGVTIAVWSIGVGRPALRLTERRWSPTSHDAGRWTWLEAPSGLAVPADTAFLQVRINSNLVGEVDVDDVQLGEPDGIDGNPRTLRLASYVGWYRSPAHPASVAQPADPRVKWGNWAWTQSPACAPGSSQFDHDPDTLRANGRRDGAVGTLDGIDQLPLIGLYDSRDVDVATLAVDLARGAGLHGFLYDFHGQALNTIDALPGETSVNGRGLEALLDAAERPGRQAEVALMIEPKVHQWGWVDSTANVQERRAGIVADLVAVVRQHAARPSLWRTDGEIGVFVFWHDVTALDGSYLNGDDWSSIETEVEQVTGEGIALFATHPPSGGADPFHGYARWDLVGPSILRFTSWPEFLAGAAQSLAAGAADAFARARHAEAVRWADGDESQREDWSLAWSGFDDSGVAGWGGTSGIGSNGGPLCVRVAGEAGPGFLRATARAANAAPRMLVCTWNDWNERTALEPRWNARFAQALALGIPMPEDARRRSLGPLLDLQKLWLGAQDPEALEAPLRAYFAARAAGQAVGYE